MSLLVANAKESLKKAILDALNRAIAAGLLPQAELPPCVLEVPADRAHGDWSCNIALAGAKVFRTAPQKIAQAVKENIDLSHSCFKTCEIAGPGFLNFYYAPAFYAEVLRDIHAKGERYGASDFGGGKRVLVEFVSANPTGPMHIGNARGGVLGDSLASVLETAGYQVEREFYVNDAGNQVNKFAISLEARYLQLYQGEEAVPFPEDGYLGEDIKEHARNFAEKYGDRYLAAPTEERRAALTAFALPLNIQGLHEDLLRYRVEYDNWFHESTLHENGAVGQVIALLKEKDATYEKEGALWFKGAEYGSEDFVLVRSNGVPTYVVPDIAYHYNKLVTRGFDLAIDVLGADHHGYVPRLKAALTALGVDTSRLQIVLMQMVRLVRDGEVVKASKRSGKAITLVTLLEEVPVDAARFLFNSYEPNTRMDFDLDLAVQQDSQNPVYYVQYAHARICSILRNLQADGIAPRECSAQELALLTAPEEVELIRHLSGYTEELIQAAKTFDPARITKYAVNLATLFHKFYNSCRVKGTDEGLTAARLSLCVATRTVIRNALSLFRVTVPDSM